TRLRQGIVWVPVSAYRYGPVNTGPASIGGGEIAISGTALDRVRVDASGTWIDSRLDSTGAPYPARPREKIFARAAALLPVAELFVEAPRTRGAYADFYANLPIPEGTLLGAGVTATAPHGPLEGLAVTVEGRNLGNADVQDSRGFPRPGRTFFLTLTWRT